MNTISPQDGERHEGLHLSPAEKANGFAAIMKRLKGRSEQERAQLRAQADAAILGHEAYALGHENLRRGNYVAAKRWLRVAAEHSVPGAEQALEEIEVGPTVGEPSPTTVVVDVTSDLCPTGTSHTAPGDVEKWARVLQNWTEAGLVMDGARAEARQILADARRAADELIAQAREETDRARAKEQELMASERRTTAELLREAEQLQRETKLIMQKASRAAEASTAERQATQVCIDEAPQHAGTVPDWGGRAGGGLHEQGLSTFPLVRAGVGRRLLWAAADADADASRLLEFRLSSACIQEAMAWVHNAVEAAYHRARDNWPERSAGEAREAGWLPQHSVFYSGSMSHVSEVRPLRDVDLVLALGVVRLWPERQTASDAATPEDSRCSARWVSAGNEVVLATSDPEHQRTKAQPDIVWVTGSWEETVGENGRALEIVSVDEAAPAAPR